MSTTPAPAKPQKPKKEKDKEKKASAQATAERLKTVVRRLPPNLPEEIFWQSVQPWVTEDTVTWKTYYTGKLRKKLNKENIPSRAYIAFKNEELLALFSREYDGHVFRDKAGVESQAVVEFAPYSKIPIEKKKPDNRNATIEKDEDYISFLESLKAAENVEPISLETLIAASQSPPAPKTTPLLEALKAEKSASRDKEAILRNHTHYTQIAANPSRKDEKKKSNAPSAPAKSVETTPSTAPNKKGGSASKKGPGPSTPQDAKPPKSSGQGQSSKNQQNQQQQQQQSTNAPATPQSTSKTPKPPRPPRPPKQEPRGQPTSTAATTASSATPPPPTPDGSSPAPATEPAPRRGRPVIGLASRQFEAALSGVAGLAGVATERKRREREREAREAASAASASPSNPTTSSGTATAAVIPGPGGNLASQGDGAENDKSATPRSPKKDKPRRGRGGGGGGGGGGNASPEVKVLAILQRSDAPPVIRKEGPSGSVIQLPEVPTGQGGSSRGGGGGGGGGGRRGRGGRGRGGSGGGGGGGNNNAPANAPTGGR